MVAVVVSSRGLAGRVPPRLFHGRNTFSSRNFSSLNLDTESGGKPPQSKGFALSHAGDEVAKRLGAPVCSRLGPDVSQSFAESDIRALAKPRPHMEK